MPKRYYAKRRRFSRRKSKVPKSVKTYVRRAINRRTRIGGAYEYTNASTEITSTWAYANLTDSIIQGDSMYERVGDIIKLGNVRVDLEVERKGTATAGTLEPGRIIIFQWLQDSSERAPTAAQDVLFDVTATGERWWLSPTLKRHLAPAYSAKVRVLAEFKFDMKSPLIGGRARRFRARISARRLRKVIYHSGQTTALNHIYIGYIGASATGVETNTFTYYVSFPFSDASR